MSTITTPSLSQEVDASINTTTPHDQAHPPISPFHAPNERSAWGRNLVLCGVLLGAAIAAPVFAFAMVFAGIMTFFTDWPAWYLWLTLITIGLMPIGMATLGWLCGRCMKPAWPWWAGAGAGLLLTGLSVVLFVGFAFFAF